MNKFDNFAEVIDHYGKRLNDQKQYGRNGAGTGDEYKKSLRELNHEFYSLPATKIVVDGPTHRAGPMWAVGELLSELFAMNPPLMMRYNEGIISESYKLRPDKSCEYLYGRRWQEFNVLLNTAEILSERRDSKRAIVPIFTPYDTDPNRKDVPCTLLYDIKIRDGKLDMMTAFRSHDFFSGMKYDVFLSSFMNQMFSMMVNAKTGDTIKPGTLHFYEGSLHSYGRDDGKLEQLMLTPPQHVSDFNVMHPYKSVSALYDDLLMVCRSEESSYWGRLDVSNEHLNRIANPAFRDFARVYHNRNAKYNNSEERLPYETSVMTWDNKQVIHTNGKERKIGKDAEQEFVPVDNGYSNRQPN